MDKEAQKTAYKQEIVPLLHQLREVALRHHLPYLVAVQIGEQVQLSGDLTGANRRMHEAFATLFSEE